jgi:hypothetical protein
MVIAELSVKEVHLDLKHGNGLVWLDAVRDDPRVGLVDTAGWM